MPVPGSYGLQDGPVWDRPQGMSFGPHTLLCDVSHGNPWPVLPPEFRRPAFQLLHGLSHPSMHATQRLFAGHFMWHGMCQDIAAWTKTCLQCQASKVSHHHLAPIEEIPMLAIAFNHMHVELVSPLPPLQGFSYLLICVDWTTRWPKAIPLSSVTAESCANAFLSDWVTQLSLDRGHQFTLALWTALTASRRVMHHHMTAYHLQSNRLVERFYHSPKSSLWARLSCPDWMDELPWALLSLRCSVMLNLSTSPTKLTSRHSPLLPGEFFTHPSPLPDLPMAATHHSPPASIPLPDLKKAEFVFVSDNTSGGPLCPPCHRPFCILKRHTKYFHVLTLETGRTLSPSIA